MTDFKLTKQTMFSTPMDVRSLLAVLEREVHDDGGNMVKSQPIADQKIEQHIFNADAVIIGYLSAVYGESILDDQVPYFLGPITVDENTSPVLLRGVVVAATAITEQWLVRFTDEDAFEVIGSTSGNQGTGNISADFTSTNSDIQIKSADWDTGVDTIVNADNQVVFSTYKSKKLVRILSAKLAAADLIDALYSNVSEEQSGFARALRKQAMDLLKALVDPKSDVSLTAITSDDIENEAVAWSINSLGEDITTYGTYTDDINPMDI